MSTVKQFVFTETGDYYTYVPVTNVDAGTPGYPTTGGLQIPYPGWFAYDTTSPLDIGDSLQPDAYLTQDYEDLVVADQYENPWLPTTSGITYAYDANFNTHLPPGYGVTAASGYIGQRTRSPIITLQIGKWTQDIRQANATYGMSIDKCRVTITGKYSVGILACNQDQYSGTYTNDASELTINYTYKNAAGTTITPSALTVLNYGPEANVATTACMLSSSSSSIVSAPAPFQCNQNYWSATVQPDTTDAIEITAIQQGSAVTGGAKLETDNLGMTIEIENTSDYVEYTTEVIKRIYSLLIPYTNGATDFSYTTIDSQNYSNKSFFTGTYSREWEGNKFIIDGIDGDTVPINAVTTLFAAGNNFALLEPTELISVATITEDSKKIAYGDAGINATATLTIDAKIYKFAIATPTATTEMLSTTNNFAFATASISSEFTQSQTPTLITDIDETFSSTTAHTATGGLIFDVIGDYTWDSLTGSWDDWPFNSWDRPYEITNTFTFDNTPFFKIGITNNPSSAFTLLENTALNEPAEADLSALFSSSFTARGIIDQGSDITFNFTTTALANAVYDAIADFDGVLSAELIANLIIASLLATPSSQFSLASSPTFKPGGEVDMSAAFEILDKLGNMIYGPDVDLSAFYSELAVGSIYQTADFYNTFKILQETRNILIAIENRQHIISEEKRLNTIKAESRNLLVPQETRRFKLKVAPVTNRFTTPKIRSPR
jgi:hypothetical protein